MVTIESLQAEIKDKDARLKFLETEVVVLRKAGEEWANTGSSFIQRTHPDEDSQPLGMMPTYTIRRYNRRGTVKRSQTISAPRADEALAKAGELAEGESFTDISRTDPTDSYTDAKHRKRGFQIEKVA